MTNRLQKGFTLIEMMVTVAILAIILGIGVPSFQTLIERNRVSAASNKLFTALTTARSEAIRRGQNITLNRTGDSWTGGWSIAAGNTTLRFENALPNGIGITETSGVASVVFGVNGRVTTPANGYAMFKVCFTGSTVNAREIAISEIGHVQSRVASTTGCN